MFSWFRGVDDEYQPVRSTSSSDGSGDEAAVLTIKEAPQAAAAPSAASRLTDTATSAFASMKGLLGIRPEVPPEQRTVLHDLDDLTTLSRTQRFYGFALAFLLGWAISIMSLFAVPQIALHPEKFAVLYTFGNIISLCSTAFLWGPCQQIKDMFKPVRLGATIVYILSMFLTLYCAFHLRMTLPTLLAIGVQMAAMAWYCASYIPYAHDMILSCLTACCGKIFS